MKYQSGESGNLSGRPRGALNKTTQLAKLLEPRAEELINKLIELALSGDSNALRLCIERLLPKAKTETIKIPLQNIDVTKSAALLTLGAEVIHSVANQEITPEQGKTMADIIQAQRKMIENSELATRIEEIEHFLNLRKQEHQNA